MSTLQLKLSRIDPGAKGDISEIAANAAQPFSTLGDLRIDGLPPPMHYPTLEHNYTLLDGSLDEFPDDPGGEVFGFWSGALSDADGRFTAPPTLDIYFHEQHKSPGLTLYFYPHTDDCASSARVTWYADEAIKSGVYSFASPVGVVAEAVDGYRRIKIELLSTNRPYRFAKLYAVEIGITRIVSDAEIDYCRVLEEVDPTGESISINTLRARIRTREPFFSPVTGLTPDEMMMKGQTLYVARDDKPFGTFFLEEWDDVDQSGIVFDLTAGDAMSVLDMYTFTGGMYIDALASDILTEIFSVAFPTGLVGYRLDPAYKNARLSGWIPICSCGAAVQHICFALSATADTARLGDLWIYPREEDIKPDSLPASGDKQPWVDMSDLKSAAPPTHYPTLEHNYTLLDGSLDEFPDDKGTLNLGWCSKSMSDADGRFAVPPTLDIEFGTNHNTEGLTLDFGPYTDEYIKQIRVAWHGADGEIVSGVFEIAENPAVIKQDVEDFRRIRLEVLETGAPYRFAKIAGIDYSISFNIPLSRQYRGGSIKSAESYTGVDVVSHNYVKGGEEVEAQDGELEVGTHRVEFSEPLHSLSITGGSIVAAYANYADIEVATPGVVILTGKKYIDNILTHSARDEMRAGEVESIKVYDGFTMVNPSVGQSIAEDRLAYFRSRIRVESDARLGILDVGYLASHETRGRSVNGVIESMDIDLRADKARLVVTGNVDRPNL